jgi:hypothetical protein
MTRDPETVLGLHQQRHPHSARASLIELMLKLLEVEAPDLQTTAHDREEESWQSVIDRVFGRYAVRRWNGGPAPFTELLKIELAAGRPVGLIWRESPAATQAHGFRAWVAIRIHETPPYLFIDLVGKMAELGGGEGQFSEKIVARVDFIPADALTEVLYCEELSPVPARKRPGPRRASAPPAPDSQSSAP